MVGLAIAAVMMTVALPTWRQMVRREQEAELVFRGQQYVRAIGLFQKKAGPGVLPPNPDVLVSQRHLRRRYKDPITGKDFAILTASAQATGTGVPGALGASGRTGSSAPARQASAAQAAVPAAPVAGAAGRGGMLGVASTSTEESIRLYEGRDHYNQWPFIFVPRVQAPPAAAGTAPAAPLAGARGGSGVRPTTGPLGPSGVPVAPPRSGGGPSPFMPRAGSGAGAPTLRR